VDDQLRGAGGAGVLSPASRSPYPRSELDWMQYMYVAVVLVFLVDAGSGGGGRAQTPVFARTGWFLIHGHACFCISCLCSGRMREKKKSP